MKAKVSIIGRGNVGKALQAGAQRAGYETRMVGHDGGAKEAAAWGDIVILAVPFMSLDTVIGEIGSSLGGKVVVDATNSLNKQGQLALGFTSSGAEELQKKISRAAVVKAFNTVFAQTMSTGKVKNTPLALLVASDDAKAKQVVMQLGKDIGFDAIDAGGLASSRFLEPMAVLNIQLGYVINKGMGTQIGFGLVR
jgi:8-hydroxy-5-deazaflavin:NADPH oxidoreductase